MGTLVVSWWDAERAYEDQTARLGTSLQGLAEFAAPSLAVGAWTFDRTQIDTQLAGGFRQALVDHAVDLLAVVARIFALARLEPLAVLEFGSPASVSDETFALMNKHFDERAITDITLLAAYYLAYGTMIKGMRVQLETKDKLDIEMRWQKDKAAT